MYEEPAEAPPVLYAYTCVARASDVRFVLLSLYRKKIISCNLWICDLMICDLLEVEECWRLLDLNSMVQKNSCVETT